MRARSFETTAIIPITPVAAACFPIFSPGLPGAKPSEIRQAAHTDRLMIIFRCFVASREQILQENLTFRK